MGLLVLSVCYWKFFGEKFFQVTNEFVSFDFIKLWDKTFWLWMFIIPKRDLLFNCVERKIFWNWTLFKFTSCVLADKHLTNFLTIVMLIWTIFNVLKFVMKLVKLGLWGSDNIELFKGKNFSDRFSLLKTLCKHMGSIIFQLYSKFLITLCQIFSYFKIFWYVWS